MAHCLQPSILSGTCELIPSLILFTWGKNNYINNNYIIMNPSCVTFMFCCFCLISKSCMTLYHPMIYSPAGSSVLWISLAIILEWIAVAFSNVSCGPRDWTHVSCLAGGSLTTEPPGKKAFILCMPNKITKCIVDIFYEGWSHEIQCASVLRRHRGPASTLSLKCLVDFAFFSKTSSHFFQIGLSIGLFPLL